MGLYVDRIIAWLIDPFIFQWPNSLTPTEWRMYRLATLPITEARQDEQYADGLRQH